MGPDDTKGYLQLMMLIRVVTIKHVYETKGPCLDSMNFNHKSCVVWYIRHLLKTLEPATIPHESR